MKKLLRIVSLILCLLILSAALCGLAVSAEERPFRLNVVRAAEDAEKPLLPGDTVIFQVQITDNPGIMAMTVAFAYDPAILTYEEYTKGIFKKDTIADHPDRGYVSLVYCDSKDIPGDGNLFSMKFKVRENAQTGKYEVKLKNIHPEQSGDSMRGCFADWNRNTLTPTVTGCVYEIAYTGTNCKHTYGEWQTAVPSTCSVNGVKKHVCTRCGHEESDQLPLAEHDFAEEWTVDIAATAETQGQMSRHCKVCGAATDIVSFSLKESEDNKFSNDEKGTVKPEQWDTIKTIYEEIVRQKESNISPQKTQSTPQQTVPEKKVVPEKKTDTPAVEQKQLPATAEELVEAVKRPDGIVTRIYLYLFGENGIFPLLVRSFGKTGISLWQVGLAAAACTAVFALL